MFVLLAVVLLIGDAVEGQHTCTGVGYYPDPADCSRFYRCTDLYGTGVLQQYMFECPAGTVFDNNLDVCNWPWAVPGCGAPPPIITSTQPPPSPPTASTQPPAPATSSPPVEDGYRPSAGSPYSCTEPGIVEYKADCQKFWLCKEKPEGSKILEALLYRCPDGYLFSSSVLRCARADDATCVAAGADTRSIPVTQLTEQQLNAFFNTWG